MVKKYASKFRHIFAEEAKIENSHSDLPQPCCDGQGQYATASRKFVAVGKKGSGGQVMVIGLEDYGRKANKAPLITTHEGQVLDIQFAPNNPYLLGSGGEDAYIHLNLIPEEGIALDAPIKKPFAALGGSSDHHQKKISLIDFNRAAPMILASGSYDKTVKVWDASTASVVKSYAMEDNIYSLKWDSFGKELAWFNKASNGHTLLTLADPRVSEGDGITKTLQGFDKKTAKLFFVPGKGWVGGCGFESNGRKRYIKLWDRRVMNEKKPIVREEIDNESSVLMPWFDEDLNLLYTYGKGSGAINWYEIGSPSKDFASLGGDRNSDPIKGGCFVPKRAMDTTKCEVARFMKLEVKNGKLNIRPHRIRVPRKSTLYQPDIYPDTYAAKDLLSTEDWIANKNIETFAKRSMNPADGSQDDDYVALEKKLTYAELAQENKELKARIKELEEKYGEKKEEETEK